MTETTEDEVPISQARANLTDLVSRVRLLRRCVMLSQHGKVRAAIIPAELGEAINHLGGPDVVLDLLTQTGGHSTAEACTSSS